MPISSINSDTKKLHKVLANQIQNAYKRVIYHNVIHHMNKSIKKNCIILSVDTEKVFDKFNLHSLKKINILKKEGNS